ncbi:BQ5605_C004g02776 [Microbotryum silenes-dioicae]|uniref:BQ5605_C004g02776 protein n=1 Tax=Microbotryum silenes-dioicae TaxID=796604 RepID=A0A2X0PAU9_9BASI|nr:BQ5605_C004g02776 [Microbotryum silenes-dioicae]
MVKRDANDPVSVSGYRRLCRISRCFDSGCRTSEFSKRVGEQWALRAVGSK